MNGHVDIQVNGTTTCAPVTIATGQLSGLQLANGARAFLGIPYAAPPLEELRWRPPQPPSSWDGVRPAHKFGPSNIQHPPPSTSIYGGGETEFSEDCLYLNIWTGSDDSKGDKNRPVLVWFHFGAFQFGSGANPMFDGATLAVEEGLTIVTVNYRLGKLGFLAHPELTAESDRNASGNYGIMDQIAALEWVQENIAAFGGDATNVTAGGVSAGASSIHILRCSPIVAEKKLFRKAICESGPGVAPVIAKGHGHIANLTSLAAAEEAGVELLELMEVSSIAELRQLPAAIIARTRLPRSAGPWKAPLWPASVSLSLFDAANPIIDGYVLPESLLTTMSKGQALDIPMLIGSVGNESSGLPSLNNLEAYHGFVETTFDERLRKEALELYPVSTDAEAQSTSNRLLGDMVFVSSTWNAAVLHTTTLRSPIWYYNFQRKPPIPDDSDAIERRFAGAFHCCGAVYGFRNLEKYRHDWGWTDVDRKLAKDISASWAAFMRDGNPSADETEACWPRFESTNHIIKTWDDQSRAEPAGKDFECLMAFWSRFNNVQIK